MRQQTLFNKLKTLSVISVITLTLGCDEGQSVERDDSADQLELDMGADAGGVDGEPRPDSAPPEPPPVEPPVEPPAPARGRVLAGVTSRGHWDGTGGEARFDGAVCLAQTSDGRFVWVSDAFSGTVRRVSLETGEVTTPLGRPYELAVVDGSPSEARFESPRGCALSSAGSALGAALWIADSSTIRRVALDEAEESPQRVETVAGRAGERGARDGLGDEVRLGYLIHDMTVSPSGDALYLADRSNNSVRVLTMEGEAARVERLAGGASVVRDGVGSEAGFDGPGGLAWYGELLLVADTFSGRLRAIDTERAEVTTLARNLGAPQGVASAGALAWLAGFEGTVAQVDLEEGRSAIAVGNPEETYAVDGELGEIRLGGSFASLRYDAERELLLYMDIQAEALRLLSLSPIVAETHAGPSAVGAYQDGSLSKARFSRIMDVVGAPLEGDERQMRWFVTDPDHYAVREVSEGAGKSLTLFGGEPTSALIDGPLSEATAPGPMGLAYDHQTGSLYVSDYEAHVIRRVDLAARTVTTIAGSAGQRGSADGVGLEARFDTPLGLALSPSGLLYVVDGGAGRLRAIDLSTGEVSTRSERAEGLWDVVVSEEGTVYASDELEATLLRLEAPRGAEPEAQPVGSWEVVAGSPGQTGPADGVDGLLARPLGLERGPDGLILIADSDNHSLRSYDPESGALGTFVGSPARRGGHGGYEEHLWEALSLYEPGAVAWEPTLGRGGVACEGALYGLWSEEGQLEEPLPPPPPLEELPVGAFEVAIGTSPDNFSPVSSGDTVTLHRGCQGAQHVWVSLRVEGLSEEPSAFELSLRDSERVLTTLYLEAEPWRSLEGGAYELVGLSLVVFDTEAALGRPLVLGAEVRDAEGTTGYGWREVTVDWGADSCGG